MVWLSKFRDIEPPTTPMSQSFSERLCSGAISLMNDLGLRAE